MAQITTKYKCGDNVLCNGRDGMITAIFIRGRGRSYEFSFADNNGNPTCVNAQEFELTKIEQNPLGFKKEK